MNGLHWQAPVSNAHTSLSDPSLSQLQAAQHTEYLSTQPIAHHRKTYHCILLGRSHRTQDCSKSSLDHWRGHHMSTALQWRSKSDWHFQHHSYTLQKTQQLQVWSACRTACGLHVALHVVCMSHCMWSACGLHVVCMLHCMWSACRTTCGLHVALHVVCMSHYMWSACHTACGLHVALHVACLTHTEIHCRLQITH